LAQQWPVEQINSKSRLFFEVVSINPDLACDHPLGAAAGFPLPDPSDKKFNSRLVAPTSIDNSSLPTFGENVEGLSHCGAWSLVIKTPAQMPGKNRKSVPRFPLLQPVF
jgi:hypothetical protein